ncbi:hypothetical protein AAV94_11675 [Lampropedia cohaerens]|uniref:Sulfur carrier protein FdhD n=1 Tax=Lampropedia cohaerens TaxID=1610491 RepID=A0A0U1PXH3_9BURK|nr:formate dehydrogenase accessory sulfurtransferase FdhD [Lampropedia cohaerens]KKW67238.1 hypothetical protein AAV94_11675 [Lampropedia cohaerens]
MNARLQTDDESQPLPAALVTTSVQRHDGGDDPSVVADEVAAEVPVALVFNGISHAVMMCSPQDLPQLALGFALSEGILDAPSDCYDITVHTSGCMSAPVSVDSADFPVAEVHLDIATAAFVRLKEHRRSMAGRTGCGICGIDNLNALDLVPQPNTRPGWLHALTPHTLFTAMSAMPALQTLNRASGAVHAAGFADPNGHLIAVYEDVGRHNALDKLLGARAMAQTGLFKDCARSFPEPWPDEGFVVMTSRASYELVRKCARLHVPVLATISAPTSLAIQVARTANLQLWGLVRQPRAIRYSP